MISAKDKKLLRDAVDVCIRESANVIIELFTEICGTKLNAAERQRYVKRYAKRRLREKLKEL